MAFQFVKEIGAYWSNAVPLIFFPEGGHDSFEDAAAALELMRWKVKEERKIKTRNKR